MNIWGNNYASVVRTFKDINNPLVICTSPFFPSLHKNEIIKLICINTNSLFVDLSSITLLDKTNYANSERHYDNTGIGIHPGDKGMESIANTIFIAINFFIMSRNIVK